MIIISTSQSQEIAKEITMKAIENNKIFVKKSNDIKKMNEESKKAVADFYKKIFEAVEETSS
ncbi:MAG: hypothetical protein BHK79_02810 [Halanaerobium sp. MDAL1]|nr:MAG: hypothetical protein BHK79_02810 [Halanaerobium sp. MDAL1]